MEELARSDFRKVRSLLEGGHIHPEILSVIEKNNPGWIFVDQDKAPKSALVWSQGIEGFYLIGDHINEDFTYNLDLFSKSVIEPRMRDHSLEYFEVSGHHSRWNIQSIFSTRSLSHWGQQVFAIANKPSMVRRDDIGIINLKTQKWRGRGYQGADLIENHLDLFWASEADFRAKGFGFAALDGTDILGVCYSSFVTADTHAIGVETALQARRGGVGTYLASLVCEEILRHGYTPYWDCSSDNEPSRKLALRLGFSQIYSYECYGFAL